MFDNLPMDKLQEFGQDNVAFTTGVSRMIRQIKTKLSPEARAGIFKNMEKAHGFINLTGNYGKKKAFFVKISKVDKLKQIIKEHEDGKAKDNKTTAKETKADEQV